MAEAGDAVAVCTYLSAVLLAGLILNATLGWSWADPIAAIAAKEGRDAWQGKGCCAPTTGSTLPMTVSEEQDGCGCSPGCSCC